MFRLAKRYLTAFKKEVMIGQTAKFIEAVFEVLVPLIMASIIDKGIKAVCAEYLYL